MNNAIHTDLAAGKWFAMSFAEQMGNVGSEVGRAGNWQKKGQTEMSGKALDRAFDLLDLTIADNRWNTARKELCRAREVLADTFLGDKIYGDTPEKLEKYFFQFALVARNNK
ncbi:MAG: hypothetical protein WCT11_00135 [Candidatus Magasanikbacteria bacterium]|jgi:hypothetical protein